MNLDWVRSFFWARTLRLRFLGLVALLAPGAAPGEETPPAEALPAGAVIERLMAEPGVVELGHRFAYAQLLLTAETSDGAKIDVTRLATLEEPQPLVELSAGRLVRPVADGDGELRFAIGGQSIAVPVSVRGASAPYEVDFIRDCAPALSKMGCNAGTCHGSANGKNGFKLSLRGYDPLFDHAALVDDLAGRRFNRAAPEQSLMLLKAAGAVPHTGGALTRPGEPYYEMLRGWIARGVPINKDAPRVESIEVLPKDPQIPLPGMKQQFVVRARYRDGTTRDVTAEAFLESSLKEVAEADPQGLVTAERRGEAAVLARFEGAYAATTVTVMGDRDGFAWVDPPIHNVVDELVYAKLKRVKVLPSDLCTDAEFLRRVHLDLTGAPPAPEQVRAFLADGRDTRLKRNEVIDRLIGSPEFIEHWTNKWSDLLQVNRRFLTEKGAWALRRWIRQSVADNAPYDAFVYRVLTADGSTYQNPAAAYYRTLREPEACVENTTQVFLGVRFNCNKCHDHPFERWTQDQYYQLAAYFAHVGRKPGPQPDEEIVYDAASGAVVSPKTGESVDPSFPYPLVGRDVATDVARREQLARWLTSPANPYFAKSLVNRIWSYLLGVGIIEPVDDIRAGNPPSNPELLARLTDDFIASGFDVQQLMRTICRSRTYQHALATNRWNEDDSINYSHALARRLSAETLFDAVQVAAGRQAKLPGVPAGYSAAQLLDAEVKVPGAFLELFGRPPRESACECERSSGVVLGQALNLVNGPTIAEAVADPANRIRAVVDRESDDARVVDELFVAILCREPTPDEVAAGVAAIRAGEDRLHGAQDLAWALLNSSAFLFNR